MATYKEAFGLSKEQVRRAQPPGSGLISRPVENTSHATSTIYDCRDPYTWPSWRRIMCLFCMAVYAFLANFSSASISSAFPLLTTPLAFNPPVGIGRLTRLVAVNVLMLGAANIWWVPLGNAFGRRPVILFNTLLLTGCSVWAARAGSFDSLLAARFFMGIAGAPADTLAPSVVGELFPPFQRGRAMAIYTIFLCLGSLFGGLCGGYIAAQAGIPWLNWINAILAGALFTACLFFQPETVYARTLNMPNSAPDASEVPKSEEAAEIDNTHTRYCEDVHPPAPASSGNFKPLLALYTYQGSFSRSLISPWLTLRFPGVWLVMLWYAGLVGGVVTISTVAPTLVAQPPYLWGNNAGLINLGGVVGTFLGALMTFFLADWSLQASIDSGSSEAEARLPVAVPGLILATTGLWTFGFCAEHPRDLMWIGLQFGLGMLSFGLMQVPSIGFNYIIESYGPKAPDCFVVVTVMRAIVSFAWTFFVGDWVISAGPAVPFGVFGVPVGKENEDCDGEMGSPLTEASPMFWKMKVVRKNLFSAN
ncbi:hypothetical protein N7507_007202 [Penicillium longicatenatum]|nr:hypothetical protein N7507_007202 [Penicillium longicatenatum]